MAIIFLSTPHRFHALEDLEDQIHKLVLLPGPIIRSQLLSKVRNLADQVMRINRQFLATKLLDRATILNILVQKKLESPKEGQIGGCASHDGKNESNSDHCETETPFTTFAQSLSQSFEAAGRIHLNQMDHSKLVRGDEQDPWPTCASTLFNANGSPIKVDYRYIQQQVKVLSLAPPTRILNKTFDPSVPKHALVSWLLQHTTFIEFDRPPTGPRIMHLYNNGNPSIDISEVSRQFYVDYDASCVVDDLGVRMPANSVVYFEFDRWDSRYNNISSMLLHFINVLVWRFWPAYRRLVGGLDFLEQTKACSLEDLFYLFHQFRNFCPPANRLTFFISCFDQCLEDQRKWFLERVIDLQSFTDKEYRIIVSTTYRNDLAVKSLLDVNLEECLDLSRNQSRDELAQEFRIALNSLIERRAVYERFQLLIENQLNECYDFPYLGHIILAWLGHYVRGAPRDEIPNVISKLSPMTAENTVNVFISSLKPERRQRAKNVFNWIKHASEPWTPESLAEAIAVYECTGKDVCLDDIDSSEFMSDIEKEFGGMITVQNHDIKFSHPSFYELPEIGIENTDEPAAFVHAQLATACLHYFLLQNTQNRLSDFCLENLEGGAWETGLDAAVIMHQRTSMAEYAVRFWPQHYKSSGKFKPNKLVRELFSNKKALASWKVPFYVLSNPFTRIQRSYISPLPTFVSLGLDDLVDEELKMKRDQPFFQRDCSFAVTEAARAGNIKLVQLLLEEVVMVEEELSNALFWSAASGNDDTVGVLLNKIPDLKTFCWPEHLMYRAAAMGLDNVLAAMQQSGRDINDPVHDRWKVSALMVATDHKRTSTVKFMLQLDPKPDLSIGDKDGNDAMWYASRQGDPRMIELLLQGGVTVDKNYSTNLRPVQLAVKWHNHKALELLIAAKADFVSGKQDSNIKFDLRPPLVIAASVGSAECVRVLLRSGADPNVKCASGSVLYNAVAGNRMDIVRMLLQNNPKADIDVSPSNGDKLLIRAVCTRNTVLVSLLIEHGAALDFIDPNGLFSKTPLSRAASQGDMEMVKLLLSKGADVNYTDGQNSESPLFRAIYQSHAEVAKLLLSENGDVTWTANDGWNPLHAAYKLPVLIPDLVRRHVDINSKSQSGTILHLASRNNIPKIITILLEQNPKPDLEIVYSGSVANDVGCTALLLACKHLNPECVELLLKAGANKYFQNENGGDAISMLFETNGDSDKAGKCLEPLVSGLYNADLHVLDQHGNTLLHKIGIKTPASIVGVLAKAGVPLTQKNNDGYTPLAIAVKTGNEPAAKCLIEHGADINALSPRFGSILHIACVNGSLNLVKLLLDAGADRETVDSSYSESLLYTALRIENDKKRGRMVRYLVDEAKVPLNQKGGLLAYPIIRAASMACSSTSVHTRIIKFLIRRKANIHVADDQGRCAVHLASRSCWEDGLKALVDAGADMDVKDNAGRLPIHFAASASCHDCLIYLVRKSKDKYIQVADSDNRTPLLRAVRSGNNQTVSDLIERGTDLWVRGHTYGTDSNSEWSALKLARFFGRYGLQKMLTSKENRRDGPGGEKGMWDNSFHKSRPGDPKWLKCSSCLLSIRGSQWRCIGCDDFSLCLKCYRHRHELHDTEHFFQEIGPFFDPNKAYDDEFDLEDDNAAKERAESPEQEPKKDEELLYGGDDDDIDAAMAPYESPDDIQFDLESEDFII